jgi:hypothetical protein
MNAIGVLIMSGFAAVWWWLGLAQSGHGSWPAYAPGAACSAAVSLLALRWQARLPAPDPALRARIGRVVGIASGVEGVAILVAVNVLANAGYGDYIMPAIALIVGLHFLPLAHWIPVPLYYLSAALMCALALLGCTISNLPLRLLVTGTGMAVLLWLTCLAVLLQIRSRAQRAGLPLRPLAA